MSSFTEYLFPEPSLLMNVVPEHKNLWLLIAICKHELLDLITNIFVLEKNIGTAAKIFCQKLRSLYGLVSTQSV
jgi:hypothetical protein